MEIQNNLENKVKFFSKYWWQPVMWCMGGEDYERLKYIVRSGNMRLVDKSWLELKPLSQISDEDAIEVSKYIGQDRGVGFEEIVKRNVFGYMYGRLMPSIEIHKSILVIDFLRTRGYALPWMGLSVETLVEWGWVKLKGGEND